MPFILKDLVIDRVDLVDEGANSAAFIQLYKRKERSGKMDLKDIIAQMKEEHASVVKSTLADLETKVEKLQAKLDEITIERDNAKADLKKVKDELEKVQEDFEKTKNELDELKVAKAKTDDNKEDDFEEILKSLPEDARELFKKMKAQKEAAEEAIRKAKEAEEHAQAVSKAAELKALPVDQDKLVNVIKGCSKEVLELLTTINAAMEETVLGEIGKSRANAGASAGTSNAAWDKIEAKAEEIRKSKGVSKAKAISIVIEENPDLYKEYLQGGAN